MKGKTIFSFSKKRKAQNLLKSLNKKMRKVLKEQRYIHSVGVSYTAAALAMRYGADIYDSMIAGILHDCAKQYDGMQLLNLCDKYGVLPTEAERIMPELLHAKIGSAIARKKYGIKDENILNAIASHTTGHADMTLLEQIIFMADYIEPSRDESPNLEEVRRMAFTDLNKATIMACESTIDYVNGRGASIDPTTEETLNYYRNIDKTAAE